MARRPQRITEEDYESLDGRASKTEQKKAVQRMAALGEQLAELSKKHSTYHFSQPQPLALSLKPKRHERSAMLIRKVRFHKSSMKHP